MSHKIYKLISGVLVFAFLCQQVGWAHFDRVCCLRTIALEERGEASADTKLIDTALRLLVQRNKRWQPFLELIDRNALAKLIKDPSLFKNRSAVESLLSNLFEKIKKKGARTNFIKDLQLSLRDAKAGVENLAMATTAVATSAKRQPGRPTGLARQSLTAQMEELSIDVTLVPERLKAKKTSDFTAEDVNMLLANARWLRPKEPGEVHVAIEEREYFVAVGEDTVSLRSTHDGVEETHVLAKKDQVGKDKIHFELIPKYIKAYQRLPIHKLLDTLGLLDLKFDRPPDEVAIANGLKVYDLHFPKSDKRKLVPNGLEILQYELANVENFKVLFTWDNKLVAVIPVLTDEIAQEIERRGGYWDALNSGYEVFYFDFSDYYFDIPRYDEKWDNFFMTRCLQDSIGTVSYALHIKTYMMMHKKDQLLWDEIQRHSFYREPLVYAEIDPDGKVHIEGFRAPQFLEKMDRYKPREGYHQIIFPNYPTVYAPSFKEGSIIDKQHEAALLLDDSRFDLQGNDDILIIGPGTGIEVWMISAITKKDVYVVGINPLEVANTQFLGELTGTTIIAECNNGILRPDGTPIFSSKILGPSGEPAHVRKFGRIIWDMPGISKEGGEPKKGGYFNRFWDDDPGAKTLMRFAGSLSCIMPQHGEALVWNGRAALGNHPLYKPDVDAVQTILEWGGDLDQKRVKRKLFSAKCIDEYKVRASNSDELNTVGWYLITYTSDLGLEVPRFSTVSRSVSLEHI